MISNIKNVPALLTDQDSDVQVKNCIFFVNPFPAELFLLHCKEMSCNLFQFVEMHDNLLVTLMVLQVAVKELALVIQ